MKLVIELMTVCTEINSPDDGRMATGRNALRRVAGSHDSADPDGSQIKRRNTS